MAVSPLKLLAMMMLVRLLVGLGQGKYDLSHRHLVIVSMILVVRQVAVHMGVVMGLDTVLWLRLGVPESQGGPPPDLNSLRFGGGEL